MTLITFFKFLNIWILFYSYWLINVLVKSHAKTDKSDFFLYLGCLFYGALFGGILGFAIPYFFDLTLLPTPEISNPANIVETQNLFMDLNPESFNNKNFEEQQKEFEELRSNTVVWVVTILVVYYFVFSLS